MLLLALMLQVTADAPAVEPAPQRFSILAPVANQPCVRQGTGDDVIVCADPLPAQALPLPGEAVSTRPVPVNREMNGRGALAAQVTPCGVAIGGCQTGVDLFGAATGAIRSVQKLVAPGSCCEDGEGTNPALLVRDMAHGVTGLFRGKPDTSNRVPIPLDEPSLQGRVRP